MSKNTMVKKTEEWNGHLYDYYYSKKDKIYIFQNVFKKELCNKLIMFLNEKEKNGETASEKWGSRQNVQCEYYNLRPQDKNDSELDKEIYNSITKYLSYMQKIESVIIIEDSGYCLRRIWGETRTHSDGTTSSNHVRCLSIIIALNDDYDGGIIEFPIQKIKVKLNKGDMICFPPFWTHPHRVTSPKNDTYRYTINTWGIEKKSKGWVKNTQVNK